MLFLMVVLFFLKLQLFVWVDIYILNMFHEVLTFIVRDKKVRVLGLHFWNQSPKTLKAKWSLQTFKGH